MILHLNHMINPDDIKSPATKFIDSGLYFEFNPLLEIIQTDFFFRKYTIIDYDSFFD